MVSLTSVEPNCSWIFLASIPYTKRCEEKGEEGGGGELEGVGKKDDRRKEERIMETRKQEKT